MLSVYRCGRNDEKTVKLVSYSPSHETRNVWKFNFNLNLCLSYVITNLDFNCRRYVRASKWAHTWFTCRGGAEDAEISVSESSNKNWRHICLKLRSANRDTDWRKNGVLIGQDVLLVPSVCKPSGSRPSILKFRKASVAVTLLRLLSKTFGKREQFIIFLKENSGEPSAIEWRILHICKTPGGGGYYQKNWVWVCGQLPKTLTLFMTKICDFPFPTLTRPKI